MRSIREAAVVVPVCGPRVLLCERAAHLRFLPGFYSFPGGAVEPGDDEPQTEGPGPRAARHAALRELIEEVGVGEPPAPQGGGEWGPAQWAKQTDWSRWRYLGEWTTPAYAHIRFRTHFFSYELDACVPPRPNPEVAQAFWAVRDEVVARWRRGELPATPPVLAALDVALGHAEPFERAGDERSVLCAGGAIAYLPLVTPTLPPATHTNCCFVRGGGELYVVDPAPTDPEERMLLWRSLQDLSAEGGALAGVILTHLHHDHLGAAAWLAERAQVPILASEQTRLDLASGLGGGMSAGGYRSDALPVVTHDLCDGDLIAGDWRIVATPGHARGHICLWHERTGSLIAGDMIASGSTILIEPEQGDMGLYLQSLERLAALEPRLIVPSHGLPLARGREALLGLRDHRLKREQKTLEALEATEPAERAALVGHVYDDTPSFLWPLAELSLQSHLEKLEREGRVRRSVDGQWSVDAGGEPA
ncbi:MAG: MBL fold metallo-hydrolase [Myxococcota bacterium]|nr:MBL fold metallo-hydrolase [Myxococcota bacterium]